MSEQTNIAWCDSTVNFWSGCTKVSPGCANCYAEARDRRHMIEKVNHWGKGASRLKHVGAVKQALALNRKPWICDHCGEGRQRQEEICPRCESNPVKTWSPITITHRRRIFSLSLGDWLDDEVPVEWLAEMLDTLRQCDQVLWILCTKRPENWRDRLCTAMLHFDKSTPRATVDEEFEIKSWIAHVGLKPVAIIEKLKRHPTALWIGAWLGYTAPQHIWLLTSVENQAMADKRIPELLEIPAVCHGLSLEPLLGPMDLEPSLPLWKPRAFVLSPKNYIKWLIIGGESGPDARGCHHEHIRMVVEQGASAGTAVFVKQLGANSTIGTIRDKKGGVMAEWPKDLQVQQWPVVSFHA